MPVVPTIETRSATTARRGLDPAGPGPFERDLADRVALEHDGVERALDRRERVVRVDERRPDPDVDAVAGERRAAEQLHAACRARARPRRARSRDRLDALDLDPLERHARAERDGREDRDLRRRVEPGDVVGGICLRVAEPLRLGERVGVACAPRPSPRG